MLKNYIKEISKYSLLSQEETGELFLKLHNGDETAKNKIYTSNLRLVIYLAKKYPHKSEEDLMDYISEGNIGLENAINKYELNRGCKFGTYASKGIRMAIRKSVLKNKRYITNTLSESTSDDCEITANLIKDNKYISPEKKVLRNEKEEYIQKKIRNLSLENRLILKYRYGLLEKDSDKESHITTKEYKKVFKVTRQAVHMREQKLLKKMSYLLSALI